MAKAVDVLRQIQVGDAAVAMKYGDSMAPLDEVLEDQFVSCIQTELEAGGSAKLIGIWFWARLSLLTLREQRKSAFRQYSLLVQFTSQGKSVNRAAIRVFVCVEMCDQVGPCGFQIGENLGNLPTSQPPNGRTIQRHTNSVLR